MIHSCAMRVLLAGGLFCVVCLTPMSAAAQRGATGPVAQLNAEAKALSETEPERSLAIAQKAQAAARAAKDIRGEAEALNFIAYGFRNQSQLDLARKHATESIRLFTLAGDESGEAQGLNMLGLVEADAGHFPEALEHHLKALAIRERTQDKEGLAYSYNNLGNAYRNLGEHAKALEYHQKGLALKVELGMTSSEAYSHHNIGLVYFAMRDFPNALEAFRRGLAIREKLDDLRAVAVSLNSIGLVEAQTNPRAALQTHQRVLALLRSNALKGLADVEAAREPMFNQDNAARLQQLQVAYEADRRQGEIEMLERDRDVQSAELARVHTTRTALADRLTEALDRVQTLKKLLPICASCKRIRDDNGYWTQVEAYVAAHSSAEFTYSICPSCFEGLYPEHHHHEQPPV